MSRIKTGSAGHVLGHKAFARITAVEGLALTPDAEEMFRGFDRQGVAVADRLVAVMTRHSAPSTLHVVPHGEGWAVRRGGSSRASRAFGTQGEALAFGRKAARAKGGELVIHAPDGRICGRDSFAADEPPTSARRTKA